MPLAFAMGVQAEWPLKGHDSTMRCWYLACQAEEMRMEQQRTSVRKTYKYKLMPTSEQEQTLETVVWRCRELSNAGLQERRAAWESAGSA